MLIKYHKYFERRFIKLQPRFKHKVIATIKCFSKNPHAPQLRNHALAGRLAGQRAISVMGDLRIIFEEHDNYTLVIMLDVGTHNQVYWALEFFSTAPSHVKHGTIGFSNRGWFNGDGKNLFMHRENH